MSNRLPQHGKPGPTGSFKEYVEDYRSKKDWSEKQLADAARINQSELNKIINGVRQNVRIDYLVCICLALQISVPQSKDLLARAERAFSPASELHRAYLELIELYHEKPFSCEVNPYALIEADEFLRARGLPQLPDANGY